VTTDVLAEGINLHRSNIVLNYDLPWNPTRVLQRVGRVNRVGTSHEQIYIFNFFPTAQGDAQLGLEANIKAKIQAFHDMLGEDAKYLTEDEDIAQHELFGERLYSRLNQRKSYTGEDEEERSELEYLHLIRRVRDETPKLFDKVKRLPKKARASRLLPALERSPTFEKSPTSDDCLVSFFRRGLLKKFYRNHQNSLPAELDFLAAVDLLSCPPTAQRIAIPPLYYDLLAANKQTFAEATSPANDDLRGRRGGRSNSRQVIEHLKTFRREQKYTETDQAYVRRVLEELQQGNVPSNRVKRLLEALQGVMDPLKVLAILHQEIPEKTMQEDDDHERLDAPVQVILSAYLRGENE
jgi:superfamily II DNA/RNA helicase